MSTIERAAGKLKQGFKPTAGDPKQNSRAAPERAGRSPGSVAPTADAMSDHAAGGYRTIDLARLTARGYVTKENSRTVLASDFRRIKRPLLTRHKDDEHSAPDANPRNLILVTSALPGEGKTFASLNLALSIAAEVDSSVLLVDGDALKGDIARLLGIDYQVGLIDVVREGRFPESAIIGTNIEGFSVLPAGYTEDSPDELFASDMMRQTLHDLARENEHRIVIVDGPPLMAGTMASVMARICGQVVLVVEAERTAQDTVAQAVELVDGCDSVSLMLNKATRRPNDQLNYGYGYAYGYGQQPD
jgi:protein-tyrosine kinase